MKNPHNNSQIQINSGSMADIAFLLLIFFMITTTIINDKGIALVLPPHQPTIPPAEIHERNLFKIQVNARDQLLIEGKERKDLVGLREEIKSFILNNGQSPTLSETPKKAIVSIKTSRGTSQKMFINTLDEVKAAYYEIYADRVNISPTAYRKLSLHIPGEKKLYEQGKKGYP